METNTASNIREPNDFVRQFMEIVNVSARYIDKQIKSSCFEYYTLILSHGVCLYSYQRREENSIFQQLHHCSNQLFILILNVNRLEFCVLYWNSQLLLNIIIIVSVYTFQNNANVFHFCRSIIISV